MGPAERHQRFARYADGTVWDANDVTLAVRDGPWICSTAGCPVQYSGVTLRHMRSRGGSEHTVNGSFHKPSTMMHDLSLDHTATPSVQTTVHIDDGSRRHISRVFDLQGPEPEPRDAPASEGGGERTEYDYGPDLHGLRSLLQTAREYERDPDQFRERKFRVPGSRAEYFWPELWTGPDRFAYDRTLTLMRDQFREDARAYFVEGFARDVPDLTVDATGAQWIRFRLNTDFTPDRRQIQVNIPHSTENWESLKHIQWRTPVAVWSHRVYRVRNSFPLLNLPDWRHVLADGNEHMVRLPRVPDGSSSGTR